MSAVVVRAVGSVESVVSAFGVEVALVTASAGSSVMVFGGSRSSWVLSVFLMCCGICNLLVVSVVVVSFCA